MTLPDPSSSADRHAVAVARSLASADSSAQDGDYVNALAWLDALRSIGEPLPAEYAGKERAWRAALRDTVRAAARSRTVVELLPSHSHRGNH